MKAGEALKEAVKRLKEAGVEEAHAEAEYLLTHVLGCRRHALFLDPARALSPEEACKFSESVRRRAGREPAQYIIGSTEFMGLTMKVTPQTLIPRPETELLVEEVLRLVGEQGGRKDNEGPVIIDLCTGSGCVAVSLAKGLIGSKIYATDISAGALEVASYNALANNVKDRVVLCRGDLYKALEGFGLEGMADFITANPPYVTEADYAKLPPEIKAHEPEGALRAGPDGLKFIRRIIAGAGEFLRPGGRLVMEIGYGQSAAVKDLAAGAFDVEFKKDLAGIERILVARA